VRKAIYTNAKISTSEEKNNQEIEYMNITGNLMENPV
jgi:hypothetical protein